MSVALLHNIMKIDFGEAFEDDDVTEISVNKPYEFFIAKKGCKGMQRIEQPKLSYKRLKAFADLIATNTHQKISDETPLLSAQIESVKHKDLFYRIQVVKDPAVYQGRIALSIRKPSIMSLEYDIYRDMFDGLKAYHGMSPADEELLGLYENGEFWQFVKRAVQLKKNVLISAGTDSGKTTLFNSLIKLIDMNERIITIEDAKELDPPQPNTLQLYYSRGGQGTSKASAQHLMEACLRLRPERIFLGEIRGDEAFMFLNLISSGHPGAIATIHADTPELALDRMSLMVLRAGTTLNAEQVKEFVRQNIDVIIQLKRTPTGGYGCENIYYKGYAEKKGLKS